MPQSKPMMWIKFMIIMNLLSMILVMKMSQSLNMKGMYLTKTKMEGVSMKW